MMNSLLEKLGELFDNLAIPFEMIEVYNAVTSIWEAFPLVVRFSLIGCFAIACFFAVLKMLF